MADAQDAQAAREEGRDDARADAPARPVGGLEPGGGHPLRAILVGAGGMGRAWLRTIADCEEVDLAGIVDIDLARAKEAAAEFAARSRALAGAASKAPAGQGSGSATSEVPAGDDLAAMAAAEGADFVVDVTVPEAHHPVTLRALSLGLPVLGEKPLAAGLGEALELAAAAEAYDRLFMVSQSRRYNPQLFAYRNLIRDLGRLGILTAAFFKAPRFGGFREEMASPLVLDMAIHAFDSARFLAGAEPVAVYCEEFNPAWSWYGGDAAANAVFELANGARFVYNGSWCSPGSETSWNASWRASASEGTALWDGDHEPCRDGDPGHAGPAPEDPVSPSSGGGTAAGYGSPAGPVQAASRLVMAGHTGLAGSLREFVAALRSGEPPMGECHDNVMSLAMVYGAMESSRTGGRVVVADLLERARARSLTRTSGPVHDALSAWTSLTPPGPRRM